MLKARDITISMTEDYKPTDNAVAERINGIIKTSAVYPRQRFNSIEHARNVIGRYIYFYNYRRPHMSIGNKPPALAHMEQGEQKVSQMNKMSYLCRAERQVWAKANASNPDLNLKAPSRGNQVCRTSKPRICKSSFSGRKVSSKAAQLFRLCL